MSTHTTHTSHTTHTTHTSHYTHTTHAASSAIHASTTAHSTHSTSSITSAIIGAASSVADPRQGVSGAGATEGGSSHGTGLNDADALTHDLIIQVTCVVFGLIGLIILLRLPSLVNFLRSRYGRPFLQVLGSGSSKGSTRFGNVFNGGRGNISRMSSFESYSSSGSMKKEVDNSTPSGLIALNLRGDLVDKTKVPPRRISWVPSSLGRMVDLFRVRVMPGYTLGQFLLLMSYTLIMFYGTFRQSNPLKDGVRTAWVAVCPLPLVFALGQKCNVLGSLLGYGYEALNYIHRYIGRVVVLACNVHSLIYIYDWTAKGIFRAKIAIPSNAWGLALLIAMDCMFFFSLEFFRRKAYQLFFWSHTIGIVFIFTSGFHNPALIPWMAACITIYGLDRALRSFKSSFAVATLTHLPEMGTTRVEVPTIKSGWRAGQHVRLRVLTTGMGLLGWTESHPFTIASASGANDGLVLLCKKAGDWTSKLSDLAKGLDSQSGEGQGRVKVWIEGPFGGSRLVFTSFSAAVLVVGGSGITYGLSMVEELLEKDRNDESRLRYLQLVWTVTDPTSITPLLPQFQALVQQTHRTVLKITVNYTRALTKKTPIFGSYEAVPCVPMAITHPDITLSPGRPNMKSILNGAIDTAIDLNASDPLDPSGLAVGVCGPVSLGDSVTSDIRGIDSEKREKVGGIEVHEEAFSM